MADPNQMGAIQQMVASRRQQMQAPSGGNMQANYGHLQQAPVMAGGGFMQQQTGGMDPRAMREQMVMQHQAQQMQGAPVMGVQGGPQFNPGQMKQQMAAQMMQQGVPYQATMQQQVQNRMGFDAEAMRQQMGAVRQAPTMQANYGMQQGMDVARMKQDALKGLARQPAPSFSAGGGLTRPGVMWRGG